jgi:hypothetical protein
MVDQPVAVSTTGTACASPSSEPSGPTPVESPSAIGAIDVVASVPVARNYAPLAEELITALASRSARS